jgi:hypothetical protein
MCVDKTLDALGVFPDLVGESERMEQDATQPLNMMLQAVEKGSDLSSYMTFDRDGTPVQFGSSN